MLDPVETAHDRAILQAFTDQAGRFAAGPELHTPDVVQWVVKAAAPKATDRAIDLACGPGSVVAALAPHVAHVTGLDATPAMLDEALQRLDQGGHDNVRLCLGNLYDPPFPAASFDIVTCRFAFHHLTDPVKAFAQMVRLARCGGRIVLCDAIASDDPAKADAFNAMERLRDPSTIRFRTRSYLRDLFEQAGLAVQEDAFHVAYRARDLVEASFPANGDRAGVLALLDSSIAGDTLGMHAQKAGGDTRVTYPSVVLSAVKTI